MGLNWLDYGWRFYDPVLGRWHSVDPLAEYTLNWTPYVYCYNSPVVWIDPDGRYSRLGAWIRKVTWGGVGIKKSGKEWGVQLGSTAPDGGAVIMFVTNGSKPSSGKTGVTLHSEDGKDTPGSKDRSLLSMNWDEIKLWFQAIFKDKRQSPHTSEDITIKALEETLQPEESKESKIGMTSDKAILKENGGTNIEIIEYDIAKSDNTESTNYTTGRKKMHNEGDTIGKTTKDAKGRLVKYEDYESRKKRTK